MARGRPKKLTIDIKAQLMEELEQYPMFKASAMRKHLVRMYRENLRKKGIPDDEIRSRVEHYDKKILPGESSIQKFFAEINTELKELDRLWSRISLAKYPIPPDVLPVVLRVWAKAIEKDRPLTIRQALWAVRLYCVFKDNLDGLWEAAVTASYHERTLNLEKDGYPETREGILWYWVEDAYLHSKIDSAFDITGRVQKEFDKLLQKEANYEGSHSQEVQE